MGAMQSHLNQNIKTAKMKERMQQKLEQRKAEAQQAALKSQEPIVFSTGEKVERTPRFPTQSQAAQAQAQASFMETNSVATATSTDVPKKKKNKNKNKK